MNTKIKTLEELTEAVQEAKKEGKRVVLCHGVFDLLHPGHIRHFEEAKKQGDLLVVTITPNRFTNKGPGRPFFSERLRAESIAALQCVDCVAVNEWPTAIETIQLIKPDFYAKGTDYADSSKDVTGNIAKEKESVEAVGGRIHFTDDITFSSSQLINSFFDIYPPEAKNYLKDFKKNYSIEEIVRKMEFLKKLKILVIGETIIDEYHYCKAIGKPQKDSILATKYVSEEQFAGGILACANHVAGFCDEVHLATALGEESSQEPFVRQHLKPNIKPFFFAHKGVTIRKRRFVEPAYFYKMFEESYLTDEDSYVNIFESVGNFLAERLKDYDLVLVADFGHGFFNTGLIDLLGDRSKFLAVNTQTNSGNSGFNMITKYPKADYVCIDEPELRLALHDRVSPLDLLLPKIAKQLRCGHFTVTRGHLGSLTHTSDQVIYQTPVFSTQFVDRTGAGDAYLSITAPCVAAGFPVDLVGFIGNAVGAMAVQVVCNRSSVEPAPLLKFITSLLK